MAAHVPALHGASVTDIHGHRPLCQRIRADGQRIVSSRSRTRRDFEEPATALLGIVFLRHQLGYYNILPLYILLVFLSPFILFAVWRAPLISLAVSVAIYIVAQLPQVNLPSWPLPGLWAFNPFAWQFAFVAGMVIGVLWKRDKLSLPASRPLMIVSTVLVAFGAIVATDAFGFAPACSRLSTDWAVSTKPI